MISLRSFPFPMLFRFNLIWAIRLASDGPEFRAICACVSRVKQKRFLEMDNLIGDYTESFA